MLNFDNIIIQFNIYVGLLLVICGVLGNIINVGIFYTNHVRNASTFILFSCSWASLIFILIGLLTRVIAVGFQLDWTTSNLTWCRTRFYLNHVSLFVSITYMCYAAIDQLFITSSSDKLRQLSNLGNARRATLTILIFWILHHIPILVLTEQVPTIDGFLVCTILVNQYLNRYISFFMLPIVSAMGPIILLIIVGTLTYRNVSKLKLSRVRQRAQRHLTSMILLQTISIVVGSVPFGFYYTYAAITSTLVKNYDRLAIENLISQIVTTFFYFSHAFSFFVYFISSRTFRHQVWILLGVTSRRNRVNPLQE